MEGIKKVLQVTRKGGKVRNFERFYICNETLLDNHIYNKCTVKPNAILDTIIQNNSGRRLAVVTPYTCCDSLQSQVVNRYVNIYTMQIFRYGSHNLSDFVYPYAFEIVLNYTIQTTIVISFKFSKFQNEISYPGTDIILKYNLEYDIPDMTAIRN